ncbi:hypothetical protein, partial [Mesorhizobium sp. M8A.F.Ca.ET.167.01.1.1]|uniref:hypothetical protein n=1 Tax=Mesorhizobium sp. M8A.F.Ca.ET.167.01.1.1 TaxID=2563961 RepID=UPI001AEE8928
SRQASQTDQASDLMLDVLISGRSPNGPEPRERQILNDRMGRDDASAGGANCSPKTAGRHRVARHGEISLQAKTASLSGSKRPLRTGRSGGVAAAGDRRLRPQAHLFRMAHQFGKHERETSHHQEDYDQARHRQ